jgi:hypothetical protein
MSPRHRRPLLQLHDNIRKKEESLQNEKMVAERIIPCLLKYTGGGRQCSAEIFISLKGLRTAYEILLKEAKPIDVLRYFYPFDDYQEMASPLYFRLHLFQKLKSWTKRGIHLAAKKD